MKGLTPRQIEIVELRLQGLMHKEIARKLCITENTVRNHVSNVHDRLDIPKQGFYTDKKRMVAAHLGKVGMVI